MENQNETANVSSVQNQADSKPAKKGSFLKKLLYFIVAIIVIIILVLGYLGFMPGVSSIFGSDKPRDLGVEATSADEVSVNQKANIKYSSLSSADPKASLSLSGSQNIDTALTDEELTALMAEHEKMWKYYPISDAQVKFNEDGTAEVSGILRTDRIAGYAAATGIGAQELQSWLDKVNIIVSNPPIYIKGRAEVKAGVLTGELQKVEIGRLPIPMSSIPNQSALIDFALNRLGKAGVKIQSGNIEAGKVNLKAAIPAAVGFSQ